MLTRRLKPEKVYSEIDWTLLLMLVGLLIVVAGLRQPVLTPDMAARIGRLHLDAAPVISLVTAGLSKLGSNVHAVLVQNPSLQICRIRRGHGFSLPWPPRLPVI